MQLCDRDECRHTLEIIEDAIEQEPAINLRGMSGVELMRPFKAEVVWLVGCFVMRTRRGDACVARHGGAIGDAGEACLAPT